MSSGPFLEANPMYQQIRLALVALFGIGVLVMPVRGSQRPAPKLLQAAGSQTAMVGKWHLVSPPTGFDYWEILPGQGVYYNPPMIRNGERVKHTGYVTDIITDLAVDWLKKRDQSK